MKAIIEIDMSGAAFDDTPATELAERLCELATDIREYGAGALAPVVLRDSNGNTCGTFRIDED